MAQKNKIPDFRLTAKKIIKERPRMVAVESQKFFKDSFVRGGFTDTSFQAWAKRISPFGGKKILIGKDNTMNLMQSIRVLEENEKRVRVGSELGYSEIHNDGGSITVTAKMKKYWWAMYCEILGIPKKAKNKKADWNNKTSLSKKKNGNYASTVQNKAINAKAEYCKRMALMRVGSKIKMPKRQYIGESKTMLMQFEEWFYDQIDNAE